MAGLKADAGLYFTFLLFTYFTTLTTTAFFRFVGYSFSTFNDASKVSGTMFSVLVTVSIFHRHNASSINDQYAGYIIYTPSMKPWFSWIRWINPIYYAFEALYINELDGLSVYCAPPQLFPLAPGGPQGCAIAGAEPGANELMGQAWGNPALEFYKSHVWRNFGIIIALWLFCLAMCVVVIERLPAAGSNKAVLLYKRGGGGKFIRASNQIGNGPKDEEEGSAQSHPNEKQAGKSDSDKVNKQVHVANT